MYEITDVFQQPLSPNRVFIVRLRDTNLVVIISITFFKAQNKLIIYLLNTVLII